MASHVSWGTEAICLDGIGWNVEKVAAEAYRRTCRVDFHEPGFCAINLGQEMGSVPFRRLMVDLVRRMAGLHLAAVGKGLSILSVARFDQQMTTKPHLDGGPAESLLVLGYEPSEVGSALEIIDYSACAFGMGLTPGELLAKHNPMFRQGYELLRPYAATIPCFSRDDFQIVCINNSSTAYPEGWQGVLHTATILTPDESKRRVINSMMIASVPRGEPEGVSEREVEEFVNTSVVRRKGYDKGHLDEDR